MAQKYSVTGSVDGRVHTRKYTADTPADAAIKFWDWLDDHEAPILLVSAPGVAPSAHYHEAHVCDEPVMSTDGNVGTLVSVHTLD